MGQPSLYRAAAISEAAENRSNGRRAEGDMVAEYTQRSGNHCKFSSTRAVPTQREQAPGLSARWVIVACEHTGRFTLRKLPDSPGIKIRRYENTSNDLVFALSRLMNECSVHGSGHVYSSLRGIFTAAMWSHYRLNNTECTPSALHNSHNRSHGTRDPTRRIPD